MSTEKIFAGGFRFDKPSENAPDFVKGKLSVNVDQAIAFLQQHKNERGWVNIDLLKSQKGSLYMALNNYKKPEENTVAEETEDVEEFGNFN